jgi:hypothetical protein
MLAERNQLHHVHGRPRTNDAEAVYNSRSN